MSTLDQEPLANPISQPSSTVGVNDSVHSTGEPTSRLTKRQRLQQFSANWKDLASIVGTFISTLSLAAAATVAVIHVSRYGHDRQTEEDKERYNVMTDLLKSETRYQMLSPKLIGRTVDGRFVPGLNTVIVIVPGNKINSAYFRLPRQKLVENRMGVVSDELVTYSVATTREGPSPIGDISVFDCIDCNSRIRFESYSYAKDLTKNVTLTSYGYITLARAAIDVGEVSDGENFILLARRALKESRDVDAVKARDAAEIAKTLLLMGNADGMDELEIAKKKVRRITSMSQFKTLHDLMLWQAQYSAKASDMAATDRYLKEYSKVVAEYGNSKGNYGTSKGKSNAMIREAYESCIAILASRDNNDPVLEVPPEYEIFNGRQWDRVSKLTMFAKPDAPLPYPLEWVKGNFIEVYESPATSIIEKEKR